MLIIVCCACVYRLCRAVVEAHLPSSFEVHGSNLGSGIPVWSLQIFLYLHVLYLSTHTSSFI